MGDRDDDEPHRRNIFWLPVDIVVNVGKGVFGAAGSILKGVGGAVKDSYKDVTGDNDRRRDDDKK